MAGKKKKIEIRFCPLINTSCRIFTCIFWDDEKNDCLLKILISSFLSATSSEKKKNKPMARVDLLLKKMLEEQGRKANDNE